MAHEITSTDHLFSVRKPTWHGLGAILPGYPTREEAQQLAHPWEPVTEPVYAGNPRVTEAGPVMDYLPAEGWQGVHRSDTGALLGIVRDTYEPVSNTDLWDIAEAIQGDGVGVRFETGGSLKGGAKVWALLALEEPVQVVGDPNGAQLAYYSLQNAHDGSGAFRGQATNVRIVCANTAHLADLDARAAGTEFVFRHTKNVKQRIEDARAALAGWRAGLDEWQQHQQWQLAQTWLTAVERDAAQQGGAAGAAEREGVAAFLDRFIPAPPAEIISERVRANVERERDKWRACYYGATGEGVRGSMYGLVQASIEYGEHYRTARTSETRFQRSYLDRNKLVQASIRLAELVAA